MRSANVKICVGVAALMVFGTFGCGNTEETERLGEVHQLAIVTTPLMPVRQVINTSSSSGKLTFILTPASPLFIGTIVLTKVTSATPISGTLVRGVDATHPSKILLYVNGATFDAARSHVLPFKVDLGYDDVTLDVSSTSLTGERNQEGSATLVLTRMARPGVGERHSCLFARGLGSDSAPLLWLLVLAVAAAGCCGGALGREERL